MDKIKQLQKQLDVERAKEKSKELEKINKLTGIRIGDVVEFTYEDGSGGYDSEYYWSKGEVYDIHKSFESIFLYIKGRHTSINLKDAKLFNENDYEMRHSIYERELDLEDEFQLIVEKPKSTKGKVYKVYKILKEVGENIQYFYWNDYNKSQSLYEGEFYVTKP